MNFDLAAEVNVIFGSSEILPYVRRRLEAKVDDALWTRPWRNFFQYFEIMVSNGSMNPETLFEHG